MKSLLLTTLVGVAVFIAAGYSASRVFKRNDVADVCWGLGFVLIAAIQYAQTDSSAFISRFVLALVAMWGLRLSGHIFLRSRGKPEDSRYRAWREDWKEKEPLFAFFKIFVLQGFLLGIISFPVSLAIRYGGEQAGPYHFLGLCLFIFGLSFEAAADAQLYSFKKDSANQGKILQTGVWGMSRHPNYFGEILIWWGLWFLAVAAPFWLVSVISPILLTFLIIKVSGVAMLEKNMKEKSAEYRNYARKVPALIPLSSQRIKSFALVVVTVAILDYLWLGVFMQEFYTAQAREIARMSDNAFDTVLWAAAFVYFFIPFGIAFFACSQSPTRVHAAFKGALYGLVLYAVYDFTNLALLANWPAQMSLVDIGWGAFLCSAGAFAGNLKGASIVERPKA